MGKSCFVDSSFIDKWILQNGTVVDLRSEDEYRLNHIDSAVNFPWTLNKMEDIENYLREKNIHRLCIYCNNGKISKAVVLKLREKNIEAYSLSDGINRYSGHYLIIDIDTQSI